MTRTNGCHNRPPFQPAYIAQDGWKRVLDGKGGFVTVRNDVEVAHFTNSECQWSKSHYDAGCFGCKWKQEAIMDSDAS